MNPWVLFVFAILYFFLLFGIALYGDSRSGKNMTAPARHIIYSLALAVYCSSWTFYGAVGSAANGGWSFLPIYLGPFLVFVFGYPLIHKMIRVGKRQNTTSIADFLSSRYSKKKGIALIATMICTVAGIPYIALQLKAVTNSILVLSAASNTNFPLLNTSLTVAALMVVFAILFGTRQVDASRHHHGMMLTIAFESLVKLAALVVLAAYVIFVFYSGPAEFRSELIATNRFIWQGVDLSFLTQLLLASGAILVLPRQFHVMVVESINHQHLKTARWLFPAYLIIVSLAVLPITAAGLRLFQGSGVDADTFVLLLPQVTGQTWLSILVFIGGFSASMAMIVITTLTLSTMLSNDALLPFVINRRLSADQNVLGPWLLAMRRFIIGVVIFLAWSYNALFSESEALSATGLLAFSLVVQLIPALIGGLYWRKAHASGAYAGMISGSLVWFWTLLVPLLARDGLIPMSLLENGPLGVGWLRPEHLLGFQFSDPLSHGVFFSLAANCFFFVRFSRQANASLTDQLQASAYVLPDNHGQKEDVHYKKPNVRASELVSVLERFAGMAQTKQWIGDFERVHHVHIHASDLPSPDFIRYIERKLSGVIGASSARAMMHSALAGRKLHLEDVVNFFDETTQAIHFNQQVLSSTLENLDNGVSVIDREQKLVAWNRKYLEMYQYPKDMIRVGSSIEELIRYNAERGECGPGEVEDHVRKRMTHLRMGTAHRFIRMRSNGRVTEIRGNPLPGGGFVATFNDITEYVHAQDELREAKANLEQRVEERTEEVRKINKELREEINERERAESMILDAKNEAELANESKTRFLALASHDILQPLNAARLYNTALLEKYAEDDILPKLESSLRTTEELISTLLEIAKLDGNPQNPIIEPVELSSIFQSIMDEFSAVAEEKSLRLLVRPTDIIVSSESRPLRRIIQNLVSNAIKYTRSGGVLLAARKRGGQVVIQIWDTGLGIEADDLERIFLDFNRLDQHRQEAQGVGLGLSVVSRISQYLHHPIRVQSTPGKGSCFELSVPVSAVQKIAAPQKAVKTGIKKNQLNLTILVIDNDQQNIDALTTLLTGWGCAVASATTREAAVCQPQPDVLIIDYHLGETLTGFTLYAELKEVWQCEVPAILVTAHAESDIKQSASKAGMGYLAKPVKPSALRALIKSHNSP
ncbi:PAS domain-containing hybrid sensor histidine kinase/response regulator [Reinekea marinisedimentorum]|uniref:histidine kinase n=1 Tax=Reinekea marinisedimentorum TaxID=230495 RepID=A0A4R3IDY2_9GAMM|nr:PAS-domain containing protein [Reinekea marinisedimentorum]TCS43986.1 Na+/proline symporter [Reinekea marinisedimentorum]